MPFLADGAIPDDQRAVSGAGEAGIVRDDHEGDAVLGGEFHEDGHDFRAVAGVEIAGGLVGKEDFGFVDNGPGDGHALLFAAGKLGREVIGAIGETDPAKSLQCGFRGVVSGDGTGDGDVFESGEFGKEMIVLENVADLTVAELGLLAAAHGVEVDAVDVDAALFRPLQTGESVEQSGFAGAAGATEKDTLATPDFQIDAVKHFDGFFPDAVAAVEVHRPDHDILHAGRLSEGRQRGKTGGSAEVSVRKPSSSPLAKRHADWKTGADFHRTNGGSGYVGGMPENTHSPQSESPMEVLRRHIGALANLPETEAPVLSVFIDLRQSVESTRSAFQTWSSSARSTLPKDHRPLFDAAKSDLEQVLRSRWNEDIQSVAAFARGGDLPLLLVIPFHATMDTHFHVSPRPAIFPLVQMKDRFHRFIVVICTEETGRILEVTLGAVSEEILTRRPELGGDLGRGWSREHYHHRKQENTRRFHRDQVEIITRLMSRRGLNHLILAGHPRHVSALREMLPKQLESRVVGAVFRSPNGQDCSPVLEQAIDAFIEAEQNESRDTVERLHEQIRRRGLAVVGIHASRRSLEAGAAAELVISEELPAADREELVRLATARAIPIEVCENDELLRQHGGVGCLLRYQFDFAAQAEELVVADS